MSDGSDVVSVTDDLLQHAEVYAAAFANADLPMAPRRRVAIVACMDARFNPYGIFGLAEGDAHVIRNAGGAVTDDVVHALAVSQRLLGTTEVILVHHVDCGMRTSDHAAFHREILEETGIRPQWPTEALGDPAEGVRRSIARIKGTPLLPHGGSVRGFVYDEGSGRLAEIV